jgi:hypothetical protein
MEELKITKVYTKFPVLLSTKGQSILSCPNLNMSYVVEYDKNQDTLRRVCPYYTSPNTGKTFVFSVLPLEIKSVYGNDYAWAICRNVGRYYTGTMEDFLICKTSVDLAKDDI